MPSTWSQELTVYGYCRLYLQSQMITKIICLYFTIPEYWAECIGSHLRLDEGEEFCEYPFYESYPFGVHQSIFANVMFNPASGPFESKILKWQLQYFMLKTSFTPLFIGISNNTSFHFSGPHLNSVQRNVDDNGMYLGFGFCYGNRAIDNPWCKPFNLFNGKCNVDKAKQFERGDAYQLDRYIENHNLVFGEIDFTIHLMKDGSINASMTIYTHPYESPIWQGHEYQYDFLLTDPCWLSCSLSPGSGIKISTFEYFGPIELDTRKRMHWLKRK